MKKWINLALPSALLLGTCIPITISYLNYQKTNLVKSQNGEEINNENKETNTTPPNEKDKVVNAKISVTEEVTSDEDEYAEEIEKSDSSFDGLDKLMSSQPKNKRKATRSTDNTNTLIPVFMPRVPLDLFEGSSSQTGKEFAKEWNKKPLLEKISFLFGDDASLNAANTSEIILTWVKNKEFNANVILKSPYAFNSEGMKELDYTIYVASLLPNKIQSINLIKNQFIGRPHQSKDEFLIWINSSRLQDQIDYLFGPDSELSMDNTTRIMVDVGLGGEKGFEVLVILNEDNIFADTNSEEKLFSNVEFIPFNLDKTNIYFAPEAKCKNFSINDVENLYEFTDTFNRKPLREKIDLLLGTSSSFNTSNVANIRLLPIDSEKNTFHAKIQLINGNIFNDTGAEELIIEDLTFIPHSMNKMNLSIAQSLRPFFRKNMFPFNWNFFNNMNESKLKNFAYSLFNTMGQFFTSNELSNKLINAGRNQQLDHSIRVLHQQFCIW